MRAQEQPGLHRVPADVEPGHGWGGLRAALAHPDRGTADAAFTRLAEQLLDPAAVGPADLVGPMEVLTGPPHPNRPRVAVLLGLLAGEDATRSYLPGQIRNVFTERLDAPLRLLERPDTEQCLRTAVLYLLAHFPAHRERILPVAAVSYTHLTLPTNREV